MRNGTLYFVHLNKAFNDGGLSRNRAFCEYFMDNGARVKNVFHKNKLKRLVSTLSVIKTFLFSEGRTIFIHQGTILFLFPVQLLNVRIIFKAVFQLLQRASNRNRLIVEVNDLPYEQSIDLELQVNMLDKQIEEALYSLKNCLYVFASRQMNQYVKEKFNIKDGNSEVIINGATKLANRNHLTVADNEVKTNSDVFKCVYAGTLNKGRQIEDLISLFAGMNNATLTLLGEWGDWLLNYNVPPNVIYLGNLSNEAAQITVSGCDLGLIQYRADRFYYNLCFPTKISFYLTAGIPVLSTPLVELMYHFEKSECVYFVEFDKWDAFLSNIEVTHINQAKFAAQKEGVNYEWLSIFTSSVFLNT